MRDLSVAYEGAPALRRVGFSLRQGEVVALMGRNGAGKSTLLWTLQGSRHRDGGMVSVGGRDPAGLSPAEALNLVSLVPQTPADLLFMESVVEECSTADTTAGARPGTCLALTNEIVGPVEPGSHPSDLSEGQRLGLVLAIQLTPDPALLLLDEPTRGLDYDAKHRLGSVLARRAAAGTAVLVATHDVEFVADFAHRVLLLAEGEIVTDGPTAEAVVASPAFAPQVAKILGPGGWLTVNDVAAGMGTA